MSEGEPRAGKRVVWRNHPRSRGEPDAPGSEGSSARPGAGQRTRSESTPR